MLRRSQYLQLTADQFAAVCQANPDAVLELDASGQVIHLMPTGSESGARNTRLLARLQITAGMHAMQESDRQQLKPLGCQQFGKILRQFTGRRQLAQTHLGCDLPADAHSHAPGCQGQQWPHRPLSRGGRA